MYQLNPFDPLAIPDFLRRQPETPEQKKKREANTKRAATMRRNGTTHIKNPPKRRSRKGTGLGMAFGAKVRST